MVYAISSDPLLQWVFWTGILLVLVTVLLLLMVFWLRLSLLYKKKRQQALMATWAPIWEQCAQNQLPESVPVLRRDDLNTFLAFWINLHEIAEPNLQELYSLVVLQAGVQRHLKAAFYSRHNRTRLLAITAIGFLRDTSYWDALQQEAMSKNPFLSLAAVRALLLLEVERAIPQLLQWLPQRTDWPAARLSMMLMEVGIDAISQPLAQAVEQASAHSLPRLIPYLEMTSAQQAIPVLERLLKQHPLPEVVLPCLQVVGKFSQFSNRALVYPWLQHPQATLRAEAAKALGKLAWAEDEPRLLPLLSDTELLVRYRAAQALLRLPHMDSPRLAALKSGLSDPFAVDVLTRVMTEQGLR
ncbi:MAG: HEAT repeat domain-containing protein [Candidatus Melainabacteria bacterium]|nr:HEAT repeat domain-containing protein [Candidatus Melainabacteria bacterium]